MPVADEPAFDDKGLGVWQEVEAPALGYRAIWGASPREIYAVGDGGIAVGDGSSWKLVEGVPAATYRAVWARSSSEIWIGGDGALLARSLTGWQEQVLIHDGLTLTDYSVLALGGGAIDEYAIVMTGGNLLLFINNGAAWETPFWRGAAGPNWPLPGNPSLVARWDGFLLAGDGDLVICTTSNEYGFATWEAYRWPLGLDLPRLRSISGGPGFWAGAGGAYLAVHRDGDEEPTITSRERDAYGISAASANQMFLVGEIIELDQPDAISGVTASSIEACDRDGCALELVKPGPRPLRAIWGDGAGTTVAVGDGVIVARQ
jgi:hypothetical protein